ncbi:MAG TPA: tyrosine-type recombinase/integrase [Polyangiaceae bacterium]|nr:tyrosine-type recombinase/integrase [Polyangiaceae bacterium]
MRFQHEGRTVERSTGERDRGPATEAAARIYAEVTLGVVAAAPAASTDFADTLGAWIAAYEIGHAADTSKVVEGYARGFVDYFRSIDRMTEAGFAAYMRERIGKVTRVTLRKELSALRQFRDWLAAERGVRLPSVPSVPKSGHAGTRAKNARRRKATVLTPREVARILAKLPVRGPRNGVAIRAFVTVCWETALRPYATVARLETTLHYRKGSHTLFVAREVDKIGNERHVPLSAAARAALDSVCPESGPLFPGVDKDAMREALTTAVRAAGIDKPVSIYDLRHSRLSMLANAGGPLPGVSLLAGHKHLSTTSIYVQASADAARAALGAVAPRRRRTP